MKSSYFRSSLGNWNNNTLYLYRQKRRVVTAKDQLQSGVATLGIGSCLLIGCYLFLSQLALHGW